jgi:hypothetical protein
MRIVGVLLGSLIGSAMLAGVWAWNGAATRQELVACRQSAEGLSASATVPGSAAPAQSSGRAEGSDTVTELAPADPVSVPPSTAIPPDAETVTQSDATITEERGDRGPSAFDNAAAEDPQFDPWQPPTADIAATSAATAAERGTAPVAEAQSAVHWHSFWQPFTSEVSARGFAARLEQLTGLDFQVRRAGVGEYEVAFAHLDDNQRQAHLDRIQTVTGLNLNQQEKSP